MQDKAIFLSQADLRKAQELLGVHPELDDVNFRREVGVVSAMAKAKTTDSGDAELASDPRNAQPPYDVTVWSD